MPPKEAVTQESQASSPDDVDDLEEEVMERKAKPHYDDLLTGPTPLVSCFTRALTNCR